MLINLYYNIACAVVLSNLEQNLYVRTAVLNKMTCAVRRAVSLQLQNFRRVYAQVPLFKGPGKRGHILADTLLLKMFLGLRKLGKCFSTKAETFFLSATNVARGQMWKHLCLQQCVHNNVSLFARALR